MSTTKAMGVLVLVILSTGTLKAQEKSSLNTDLSIAIRNTNPLLTETYTQNTWAATPSVLELANPNPTPESFDSKSRWDRRFDIDRYYPRRGTESFVNLYVGLNNYLEDGDLPSSSSLINLNPLTSWYAAIHLDNVTRVVGPVYLDWGVGLSLQDFSFENTRVEVVVDRPTRSVSFVERVDRVGKKSKINVSYLNLHFVPTFSFGRYNSFRVGAGVYGGYRIGSHAKYKYDDLNGDGQKDKFKDSLFLNPFKYGIRGQIGWDFFDLFFNYDITELFEEDASAPRLNPVTFGVIF